MKKTFRLDSLDCANCAAKMEKAILKLEGVQSATVSFFAQKLVLEADEARMDALVDQIATIVHRVDPDCSLIK